VLRSEWDEAKSRRNLRERGFDFEFAARIFEGELREHEDRRDYGERRLVSIGAIDGECHRLHLARRQTQNHLSAPRQTGRT
jgi:uncharacterized DUF497 family protein